MSNEKIPRKYFSGGIKGDVALNRTKNQAGVEGSVVGKNYQLALAVEPQKDGNALSSPIAFPGSTQWYINRLKHENPDVRARAIRKLWERSNPIAVQAVSQPGDLRDLLVEEFGNALSSYSGDTLLAAAEALGELGATKERVDGYIKALSSVSDNARNEAVYALSEFGDKWAVKPLLGLLSNADPDVRLIAAKALAKLEDSRAVEPLLDLLRFRGDYAYSYMAARRAAPGVLYSLRGSWAVEPLIKGLGDKDQNVREAAMYYLRSLGAEAVEPLIRRLGDSNSRVHEIAIWLLGELKDERAAEPLLGQLRNRKKDIRLGAIRALVKLKDRRAVGPLIEQLYWPSLKIVGFLV